MVAINVRCSLDQSRIEALVEERCRRMGIPDGCISSVTVAADDSADYGACIRRSTGYTGGATHSAGGVGKTLPHQLPGGEVMTDVVFPQATFADLLRSDGDPEMRALRDYVVSHELAHAVDFSTRRVVHPTPPNSFGASIEELGEYWGSLLLSEFAASFIAGRLITGEQYDLIAENAVRCISDGMASLGAYKLQVYWNVLVEEAKIGGSSFGAEHLSKPQYQPWARIGPGVVGELEAFAGELRVLKGKYPAWNEAAETSRLTARCGSLYGALSSR